jgi:hypothetical protein
MVVLGGSVIGGGGIATEYYWWGVQAIGVYWLEEEGKGKYET